MIVKKICMLSRCQNILMSFRPGCLYFLFGSFSYILLLPIIFFMKFYYKNKRRFSHFLAIKCILVEAIKLIVNGFYVLKLKND